MGELTQGSVACMNRLSQVAGQRVFVGCLLQPLVLEVKRLELARDRLAILPHLEQKFG